VLRNSRLSSARRPSSGLGAGAVLGVALALLATTGAAAQDMARGRQLFQLCAACHGNAGQGNQRYNAPAIGGLESWYIERQLTKFKQGSRGYRPEDATGLQMRAMARALMTDADVETVAAYTASLAPPPPPPTVKGDPARGQASYALCLACHGDRGQGNQPVGGPALTGQSDWYLVAQMQKFREGLRGTHPDDPHGAQMRPMALALPDEQAILDVVAYIRTLGDRQR
jgi:cytochrome c553